MTLRPGECPENMVMPIPSLCSCYPDGQGGRCPNTSTVWLIAPDGEPNAGGYVCREHGEGIATELREKLGENWTLVPIVRG